MLREHRWSYASLAVILVVASTVVGSAFALVSSARENAVDSTGLTTANQLALQINEVDSGRSTSTYIVVLAVFAATFLVSQSVSFIVDGRRRELALLRLSGASRGQVARMVLVETTILGIACSLLGAVLAAPLVGPYSEILAGQNNWPRDMPATVHASSIAWCVILMTAVSVVGAMGPAVRIGRTPPIDAVRTVTSTRRRMSTMRWVFASIGLLVIVTFFAAPVQSVNFQFSTLMIGGGAILAAATLAPIIVPFIAWLIGGMGVLLAPGPGLVAREHAKYSARQTAALASPVILLVGLAAVFGTLAQTARETSSVALRDLTNVHSVVEYDLQNPGDGSYATAQNLPEVGSMTRVQRTKAWSWDEPDVPANWILSLMVINPMTFSTFVPTDVTSGDLKDVRGRDVAVLTGMAELGDRLNLVAPDGSAITVRVVATVQTNRFVHGSILIDREGLGSSVEPSEEIWLAEPAEGIADAELTSALRLAAPSSQVLPHASWVEKTITDDIEDQYAATMMIIGGAAILTLVSLALSSFAAVRDRRRDLELLNMIGATRQAAITSTTVGSAIGAVAGALLALAITALVHIRMSSALHTINPELSAIVPVNILLPVLVLCVVTSIGATAVGTSLALRHPRGLAPGESARTRREHLQARQASGTS